MNDINLFVPITKIDAAQRLVYGVVTAEAPDYPARCAITPRPSRTIRNGRRIS